MKISCVCPTHGRAHIIGEAVESFRRQTFKGDMEMLILNDCPEQPLSCDVPGVRVVNLPEPIPDASSKFNRAVAEADGHLVAWWEDDDISLPGRLLNMEDTMRDMDVPYLKPARAFMHQDGRITMHAENLFFGGSMFFRSHWIKSGGAIPGEWPDASAHRNMMHESAVWDNSPAMTWFLYKWGGPVHHDSGTGEQDAAKRFAMFRERTLNHRRFRPGPQKIEPHWRTDYTAAAKEFCERVKNGNG